MVRALPEGAIPKRQLWAEEYDPSFKSVRKLPFLVFRMQMIAPRINPALFAHSLIGEDGTLEDSSLTEFWEA